MAFPFQKKASAPPMDQQVEPMQGPQMGPKPSKGPNPNFQAATSSRSSPGSSKKAPPFAKKSTKPANKPNPFAKKGGKPGIV